MNNTRKLQNLSASMAVCCALLMISLPVSVIWFWADLDLTSLPFARPGIVLDMQYISMSQIVFAGSLSMLTTLLMVYGLWRLRLLFKLFQRGELFCNESARHLNQFSLVLLISAIVVPATRAAQSIILTIGNPPGKTMLVVEIGASEISVFFISATFFVITWILQEGQRLATENAEFV